MLINGERALAYVVTVDETRPLPGYDRVKYARTNGWWCVVGIDEVEVGDKAIYFEIDSLVPKGDVRFDFMEKRKYRVKTQRMCKVLSQGLLMPLSAFPELGDIEVGTDVTQTLGISYYEPEDNERKAKNPSSNAKYQAMAARHRKIAKQKWFRWLMKREWGRKLLFTFFGKKRDNPRSFPNKFDFIHKTDEDRIENLPWILDEPNEKWLVTEKLDGTSSTYILERKPRGKFEFYVCSRNVRQMDENQITYHDHNIYWDMAKKYDIEKHLRDYLNTYKEEKYVCLQGESVGSVQGNPLKLNEDDFYVFNFITSTKGRLPSVLGEGIIAQWGMKWVPMLGVEKLPPTMEDMKDRATGPSMVNPEVMREGLVYRSLDGMRSFKNVSNEYLMKH